MYYLSDEDVWSTILLEDLWIFDKLILSRKLDYVSGPACVPVSHSGQYIVRPCVNLYGMGLNSILIEHDHNINEKDIPLAKNWKEIYEMVTGE